MWECCSNFVSQLYLMSSCLQCVIRNGYSLVILHCTKFSRTDKYYLKYICQSVIFRKCTFSHHIVVHYQNCICQSAMSTFSL